MSIILSLCVFVISWGKVYIVEYVNKEIGVFDI